MIAQERSPLRVAGNRRRIAQNVDNGGGALVAQGIVNARHDREMEAHMAFGLLVRSEVFHYVIGPLIRLGKQNRAGELLIQHRSHLGDKSVGLR